MDSLKSVQKEGNIGLKQDLLLYGKDYHVWRCGKYLGIATYTDDENIGDAFLELEKTSEGDECYQVLCGDEWKFV